MLAGFGFAAGPYLSDMADTALSVGSRRHSDRPARDRSALAQARFPGPVALEIAQFGWAPGHRPGPDATDQVNGAG